MNIEKINKYLISVLVVTNAFLLYGINKLPDDINIAIKNAMKQDTVTVTVQKNITADLQSINDLIYIEGKANGKPVKIKDEYPFNPKTMPEEIYNGYLIPIRSHQGGEYFIWSRTDMGFSNIKGWFNGSRGKYQHNDKFIQLLYPVVEKL